MKLTSYQQLYITLNQKIINKRFENYKEGRKHLDQLLENGTLQYEDYWSLCVKLQDTYKNKEDE